MAKYFLESSAFTKRYKKEKGSEFVNSLFPPSDNTLFYLNLTIFEIRKIFYRLRYYSQNQDIQISDEELNILESVFAADLLLMQRIVFTDEMISRSTDIFQSKWLPNVFDAAQLIACLVTKEVYDDIIFVCSDSRSKLLDAAQYFFGSCGVIVPENK